MERGQHKKRTTQKEDYTERGLHGKRTTWKEDHTKEDDSERAEGTYIEKGQTEKRLDGKETIQREGGDTHGVGRRAYTETLKKNTQKRIWRHTRRKNIPLEKNYTERENK